MGYVLERKNCVEDIEVSKLTDLIANILLRSYGEEMCHERDFKWMYESELKEKILYSKEYYSITEEQFENLFLKNQNFYWKILLIEVVIISKDIFMNLKKFTFIGQ